MKLFLQIPSENKLSSNETLHPQVKAKKASFVKNLAYETGYSMLTEEQKKKVAYRKSIIDSEDNNKIIKGRIKRKVSKRLKEEFLQENPKAKYKADNKKIQEEVDLEFSKMGLELEEKASDIDIDYVFDKLKITIYVANPTSHLIDPPNFYPTVKPIIDGLTYAGFWEDDNFNHIQEVSFRYDSTKSEKGFYNFTLIIEEVGELHG